MFNVAIKYYVHKNFRENYDYKCLVLLKLAVYVCIQFVISLMYPDDAVDNPKLMPHIMISFDPVNIAHRLTLM